jgi:predicted small secreted protein
MFSRETLRSVVLVVLLLLAGCNTPVGGGGSADTTATPDAASAETETAEREESTPDPTTTPRSQDLVNVYGGELPVNATRLLHRVFGLYGLEPQEPVAIQFEERSGYLSARGLFGHLGYESVELSSSGGKTYEQSTIVTIFRDTLKNETELTRVLVHEFVHVVQYRQGWDETIEKQLPRRERHAAVIYEYMMEGTAVATVNAYAEQYDTEWRSPVYRMHRRGAPRVKLGVAPYALGGQYAEERFSFDDPESYFENPPRTTSTFLHGRQPESATLPNLSVSVTAADWEHEDDDRFGEVFLRTTLLTQLNESRSAAAANGWVNDEMIRLSDGNATGYVWTVAFEDQQNATEFETVASEYLDGLAGRENGSYVRNGTHYRLTRTGSRTVTLVFGPESFVTDVNVTVGGAFGSSNASTSSNASAAIEPPCPRSPASRPQSPTGRAQSSASPVAPV